MKIFNYQVINYKRFAAFFLLVSFLVGSMSFIFQKAKKADAAITDCTTVSGNLVQNCSFEDPATLPAGYVTSGVWNYPTFYSTYTGLTGWTFITPGTGNVTMATGGTNFAQGSRAIDLSGVYDTPSGLNGEIYGSGIEQTVSGLTVGQQYTLSFYQTHATIFGITYPSRVKVMVDGNDLGFFVHTTSTPGESVGSQIWTENSVTFTATGTSAVIQLLNDAPTPAPTDGPNRPVDLIDNIVLKVASDTTAPTLSIISPSNGAVVSGAFTTTICPSEPITGLALSDIVTTNGTPSGLTGPTIVPTSTCAGGEIYTVTITPTIEGSVTLSIPLGSVTDGEGNANTAPSNTVIVLYDITPTIIDPIHIESNNTNANYATTGNVITLTYTLDVSIDTAKQIVTIAGTVVTPVCVPSVIPGKADDCTATYIVPATIPPTDGLVPLSIEIVASPYEQTSTLTTDGSWVTIDRVPPIVVITDPVGGSSVNTSMTITGQCEYSTSASTTVTISGSNFTPNPTTATCMPGGLFSATVTNPGPGNPTITATQVDLAGNSGSDTESYVFAPNALPVVTIVGPTGIVATGTNTITGACTTSASVVTISGTGFTPSSGTVPCIAGSYTFPITITGNTVFTVSQTNGMGTTNATGTTTLPSSTGSSSGGGTVILGGGCMPGYPCSQMNTSSTQSQPVIINNQPVSSDNACPAFTQYLKQGMRDGENGISEVSKVQSFLNRKLGMNLNIDGIFGKHTKNAVKNFQSMYFANILNPWVLAGPTGWWYQSTRSYANYLENCTEGVVQLDNTVKIQDGRVVN